MGALQLDDYTMIRKWKKEMRRLLGIRYPQATRKEMDKYLGRKLDEHLKVEDVEFYNNYTGTRYASSTLDITEYYYKVKPITTEHGVLFDPHADNPASKMLMKWKYSRTNYKNLMKDSPKDSFEYSLYDLYQLLEKIKSNSYYGVSGARTSIFYNLHSALSVTGKGQTLISTAMMCFEAFMANNITFRNTDECLVFIKNVAGEARDKKFNDRVVLDRNIDIERVYRKLADTFDDGVVVRRDIIFPVLVGLNKSQLNLLYYKNNLIEFCRNEGIMELIRDFMLRTEVFNNPGKVPEDIVDDVTYLWDMVHEYVFYNYPTMDRIHRLKTQKRKAVLIIDTDSNFINLDPWYQFVKDEVFAGIDVSHKDPTDFRYTILYTCAYFLEKVIEKTLYQFMVHCNVPKERRDMLTMKNEFLFVRILITDNKKNYASVIEFREGSAMDKLDVKGLALTKSTTNRNASKIFKDILENDILRSGEIDLPHILRRLHQFEQEIRNSLKAGETTYLQPSSVKDFNAYDDPLKMQQVVATIMWNTAFPENEIVPPDSFFIVKTNLTKLKDLDRIKDIEPVIYERLKTEIFEGNERLAKKGVYVMAIPRDEKVPSWLTPFIDVEEMTTTTMKSIMPVLKALELESIHNSASDDNYSNVISF